MADVVRPTYHAAVPADAKIIVKGGERHARFRNTRGRIVEGPILPSGKVRLRTDEYYGRIRYADGRILRVNLHVTDQEAARQLRAQKQREADQQKAGIIDAFDQHRRTPLIGAMTQLPKRTHERSRYGKINRLASDLARDDLYAAVEGAILPPTSPILRRPGGQYDISMKLPGQFGGRPWRVTLSFPAISTPALSNATSLNSSIRASVLGREMPASKVCER